jgi:hypothetical protein
MSVPPSAANVRVPLSLDQPLTRASAVAERRIAGELVLVPLRTNAREKGSVLTLNELGTFVWANLAAPTAPRSIARAIAEEFEVGLDQAVADLLPFLDRLRELGLLEGA